MQENKCIGADSTTEAKIKKRRRRRMVNGVLVWTSKEGLKQQQQSHTELTSIRSVGEDCQCKRYRCFEMTTAEERLRVFHWFRSLGSSQLQDLCLSDLITVEGVKQRRSKAAERDENLKRAEHSASFFYKLKIPSADGLGYREINVCRVAFLSIMGISRNRLRTTQKMLYNQMQRVPVDCGNEEMVVPEPIEAIIMSQIDNYELSETYSVKSMHKDFLSSYRINVPYNIYWLVFHAKFNIAKFQASTYPRCPTFDTFFETLNMFGLVDFSKD